MSKYARSFENDLTEKSDLKYELKNNVAKITIDREPDGNRLTPASLAHLQRIADDLSADIMTNCLVITGSGTEYFSSGMFNIQLRAAYSKDDVLKVVRLANETFDKIERLPQVVIGCLNGAVRAGGGELALACDIRYGASDMSVMFHETSYACFPGAGAPVRLPEIVGAGRALEMIATGRSVGAEELLSLGFVSALVSSDDLPAHVAGIAEAIASKGPLGPRGAKKVISVWKEKGRDAAAAESWSLRNSLEWSFDAHEAIQAHLANRPPVYRGS